jgi:hypothetical protein
MKRFTSLLALTALLALALPALAQWDGYLTKAGGGTGTTNADVAFGASVGKTARLVGLDCRTDLTTAAIYLASGTERHYLGTQVTTALTNFPTTSVGTVAMGDILVIQTPANVLYVRTAYGVTGTTNIATYETAGATIPVGSYIYRCSDMMTLTACTTNNILLNGECLKSSLKRMPIAVRITGTAGCSIPAATVKYE